MKYQKGINPSISCPYHIGDFAQGGVIIWLTHDGLHGLVAAIEDLEDGPEQKIQWSTTTDTTLAVSTLPLPFSTPSRPFNQYYGGFQNQEAIEKISVWESKYPAFRAAANYSITIYGVEYADWFLPSQSEICLMYGAREIINKVSVEYGGSAMTLDGLGESYYWSSHEHKTEPTKAWVMDFDFGYANIKTKTEKHRARAIRAF